MKAKSPCPQCGAPVEIEIDGHIQVNASLSSADACTVRVVRLVVFALVTLIFVIGGSYAFSTWADKALKEKLISDPAIKIEVQRMAGQGEIWKYTK